MRLRLDAQRINRNAWYYESPKSILIVAYKQGETVPVFIRIRSSKLRATLRRQAALQGVKG